MGVAERKLDDVALVGHAVAHTNKLHLLLVAFAHANDHVVDECAIEAVESLFLLEVNGAVLIDGEGHMTILDSNIDRLVDFLSELTLGTLNGNHTVLILSNGNACRNTNWQFSYS